MTLREKCLSLLFAEEIDRQVRNAETLFAAGPRDVCREDRLF